MVDTGAYAWEMTRSMPAIAPYKRKAPSISELCWRQLEEKTKEPDSWSYMMR
jgi:hypothetical protein